MLLQVGFNLNYLLPDYRSKRKSIKNQKEVSYWQQKINEQLKLYTLEENKYNIKLVRGLGHSITQLGETKNR